MEPSEVKYEVGPAEESEPDMGWGSVAVRLREWEGERIVELRQGSSEVTFHRDRLSDFIIACVALYNQTVYPGDEADVYFGGLHSTGPDHAEEERTND